MAFHRSLHGDEGFGQPFEHVLGRLCQEFPGFLPSQLWREWRRLPAGTLELLIEYRSYAASYAQFRADPTRATGEMGDLVKAIEFALVQAEIDEDQDG